MKLEPFEKELLERDAPISQITSMDGSEQWRWGLEDGGRTYTIAFQPRSAIVHGDGKFLLKTRNKSELIHFLAQLGARMTQKPTEDDTQILTA